MHGHPLVDQDRGCRYAQAGADLPKKKVRTGRFVLEAFFERSRGEQRDSRQQ
jgi:hypothetical protein